ncbi:CdaR family protein [Thiovibrio sp. JS02]
MVKQIIGRTPSPNFLNWPNNWVLKLISLFFAIFLWYFVVGEDKVDTNVFIPVEIVNLPRELVISNQFKKQLEVTISGPRGLINGINRQHISRTINLSKAAPGTTVIRNDPESIHFPRGINVLRIQPTHITLLIDELVEKDLPIEAKTVGTPASGFELAAVHFEPKFIKLAGPKTVVGEEKLLRTKAIDINGLKSPVTTQVALELPQEILDLIGETVVTADVVIKEKTLEKKISDLPVQAVDGPTHQRRIEIRPQTVSARIILPLSRITDQPESLVEVRIQTEQLPAGTHKVPLEAVASEPVRIIETIPSTVTVEIGGKKKQ